MTGNAAPAFDLFKLALLGSLITLAAWMWSSVAAEQRLLEQHDVRGQTGEHSVVLFVTEWCGYCKRLQRWLDASGVPYRALDVEKSEAAAWGQNAVAGRGAGVPTIVIGQDVYQGLRTDKLRQRLALAGFAMRGDP